MNIQKLIVTVRRADRPAQDVSWPYDHVPREGESFAFGSRTFYVVSEVQYRFVEGGAFHALVVLEPAEPLG